MNKVGNRLANMASLGHELLAEQLPAAGKGSVPLAEIDAFRGDRGREMSPAEIGRAFTDAVVIVQNERGSGTGFVVGKSGYVLDLRPLRAAGRDELRFLPRQQGGKASMKSVPAKVLYCDNHTDVALLKIDSVGPLPAVCLAVGEKVESGERVTIIGNPGLGGKILDYTMTEGIVSNARRELRHQTLIQTSAAVNPGSSGGPMFNSRGPGDRDGGPQRRYRECGLCRAGRGVGAIPGNSSQRLRPGGGHPAQVARRQGQHSTDAKYLGVRDGAVQLRRADGNETAVPLSKLSPQDQAFVRLLQPNTPGAP